MRFRVLALCLLPLLVACGDVRHLPNAEGLTIFSLEASEGTPRNLPAGTETFFDYRVLGKVEVTEPQQRKTVIAALNRAMNEKVNQSKCFIPRHGFRIENAGESNCYLVCFQCGNAFLTPMKAPGLPIGKSAQPLIDEILVKAGVPLNP